MKMSRGRHHPVGITQPISHPKDLGLGEPQDSLEGSRYCAANLRTPRVVFPIRAHVILRLAAVTAFGAARRLQSTYSGHCWLRATTLQLGGFRTMLVSFS